MYIAARKILAIFFSVLLLWLSACSAAPEKVAEPTPSPTPVPVERTEQITIPKSVLTQLDLDVAALSRRLSLYNVTENIDGSCTVHMTTDEKNVILPALRTALDAEMTALAESGNWPFLKKAQINTDGTKVTLHTTADSYDPVRDRTVAEAVYLPALLYAAFTTDSAESFTVEVTVYDERRKTIDAYRYPFPDPTPTPEASDSPETSASTTE